MNKQFLIACAFLGCLFTTSLSEAWANACTDSTVQVLVTNINTNVPYTNRAVQIDKWDENDNNYLELHANGHTNTPNGAFIFYPDECACYHGQVSAKNLGSGYFVFSQYDTTTQVETPRDNFVTCFHSNEVTRSDIWFARWQPV